MEQNVHYEVYGTQYRYALCNRLLHALNAAHVYVSNTDDFGVSTSRCDGRGHLFGFRGIAAYDAGIGAEMNERSYLRTAYSTRSSCAEDDFII